MPAASWNAGLDILVALGPSGSEDLGLLIGQLNRLLALITANDRVTIVTGPTERQQLTVEPEREIDESSLARLLSDPDKELEPATLLQLLATADVHFAKHAQPGLRPLLVLLDHQGLQSTAPELELTERLERLARRHCLITGIASSQDSDLVGIIESAHGLAFVPESEAAEHRAMVSLLAQARGSSHLPITDSYITVDESCLQLSLLLSGREGSPQVIRPNGSLLELNNEGDLIWTQADPGVTVTIPSPEPGFWRVLGEGWSGEAVLTSSLSLRSMPLLSNYAVGESITLLAYLADGDRLSPDPYPYALAVRAELLGPTQEAEEITLYDDGQHGDGSAKDGLYGTQLTLNIPGSYQLSYHLARGLLKREQTVSFKIIEPDGQERRYTLAPELINLPKLVPGRTYQQTITLTSHLTKVERFRFETSDGDTDLRSFGELVVSPSEVELQPGESRSITLAVRLQPKAAIGGYAGHLRLVPVSTLQRGQIVPLRLGVVPWPIAYWPWLAAGGVSLLAAMLTASIALSQPQLRGWLSNEALGGHERVQLRGHHFLPSPTSHRSYLMATRGGGILRVQLCVDRHDPPLLVNGLPVSGRTPLTDGDQLRFGQVIWEYREEPGAIRPDEAAKQHVHADRSRN